MGNERYVVQPNDTIESIAARFHTTPLNIASANNGGQLWIGRNLWIPDGRPDGPQLPKGQTGKPYIPRIPPARTIVGSEILSPAHTGRNEFELQLQLAIYLEKIDPGPGGGTLNLAWRNSLAIVPWPPGTFEAFKMAAKTKAETFWSNRFRIWPPAGYPFFNWPAGPGGKPCGVICTLSITYTLSKLAASRTVKCYRRSTSDTSAALDSGDWTDSIMNDQQIGYADKTGTTIPTVNITLAHEVGHLIGLEHPAAGTAGCTGHESVCYGDGGEAWQIRNIMGAGDQVNKSNAKPWWERMEQHTGVPKDQWTVDTLDKNGNPMYL